MRRALLLYNPAAGREKVRPRRLDEIIHLLRQQGIEASAVTTRSVAPDGAGPDLGGFDLVIVCGGDGTIHDALPEVVKARLPLAVVPTGTVNILARQLGIPSTLRQAVEVIGRGARRRIVLGRSPERYFHLMAGIGLDAYLIGHVHPRLKAWVGVPAFVIAALLHFWKYPLRAFEVDCDGERLKGTFAVISNVSLYGGLLNIAPRARLDLPELDLCLFTSPRHFRFFRYLWRTWRGTHLSLPDVIYRKVRCLRLSGDPSIPVQMDGEPAGHLPVTIDCFEQGIEVIVP